MNIELDKPTSNGNYLIAITLSLCLFCIYNLNMRDSNSVDTLPSMLIPVSILKYGDFNLNEFENLFNPMPDLWKAGFNFGAVQKSGDNIISSYPVGAPLIATPVYAAARITGILEPTRWATYRLTAKLAASFIVAISAGVIFLCLASFSSTASALWLSVAYGLGTGAFSIASQGMWQHGPGMLCLSLALLVVTRLDHKEYSPHRLAVAAGIFLALSVICRILNVIPAIAVTAYMCVYHRKLLIGYLAPLGVFAIWLLQYNYTNFGNFSGGYDAILNSNWHKSRNLAETGLFHHPLLEGLPDTWISPSKGLLIYSPFLAFTFALLFLKGYKHRRIVPFLYGWITVASIIFAKNVLWWGGTSFGPRYFLEMSVAMIFLIGLAYHHLPKVAVYCLNSLIVLSIFIQTFGTFYAPCGWAEKPNFADFHPERYWDWSDTEIARCARIGLEQGPLPRQLSFDSL